MNPDQGTSPPTPPAEAVRHGIQIVDVEKTFRDDHQRTFKALDSVSLTVEEGEFCVLLGPSGCGKTTLLRSIAGLEQPDAGSIRIQGTEVFAGGRSRVGVEDRPIGMVFQSYALWPHMNVEQNIRFPLTTKRRAKKFAKGEIAERVSQVLHVMSLDGLGKRAISQLSGGQQQRVALARAIVAGNNVVLFDEPLSNVDAKVREELRVELRAMQRQLGITAVYVTHDQLEAMEMADKIAVMRDGRIVQIDTPRSIYDIPSDRYVAQFVGTANILEGTLQGVQRPGEDAVVSTTAGLVLASQVAAIAPGTERVVVTSKASCWTIARDEPPARPNTFRAVVERATYLGSYTEYLVSVGAERLRVWGQITPELMPGEEVWVGVAPEHCRVVA
jgi:iron(III) transport system ATP-binding protein